MKNILATILLSASILGTHQASAQLKAAKTDTLLSYYNQLLRFNGSVLIAQDGKVLMNKGYGFRNVDKEMLCDSNSIFQVGDVTKTLTSTVVLMLHEQGKLNIKDKLSKYFKDYPNGDKITIEHLLTNTSGIYNYTDSAEFMQTGVLIAHDQPSMLSMFKDKPLTSVPGKEYHYNNSDYLLLGYIVEQVMGKSYFDVTREMILEPLGMSNSGFAFNMYGSWDKANGHFIMRYGRLMPAPIVDSSVSGGAGALFTTTGDLYKWGQAVLDKKLLSDTMWKRALTVYKDGYGYGWHINNDTVTGKQFIEQTGTIQGFHAQLRLSPKDKTIIILLCNDMGDDIEPVVRDITAIVYGKPYELPKPQQPVELPEKTMREYEGMYELTANTDLRIYYEENLLKGFIIGQDPFAIYAEKKDHFFLGNSDVTMRFVRDKDGKVIKLIIRQMGKNQEARKWR